MISLYLQGFAMLLVAFLVGLPLGGLFARRLRRGRARSRPKTARVLNVAAVDITAVRREAMPKRDDSSESAALPWSDTVT
jgi:hypothetical protein